MSISNTTFTKNGLFLGIEVGSTRIKAVLSDSNGNSVFDSSYAWENQLTDGYWSYSLDEMWDGIRHCIVALDKNNSADSPESPLKSVKAIGVSAMMHGYLAFNEANQLLVPFRTWRNTTTEQASSFLSSLFGINIPQRWSIAHFYQSILNDEEHVSSINYLTTLSGYIHWVLTGNKVLGVGDASGMFPIDSVTHNYDQVMLSKLNNALSQEGRIRSVDELLPKVILAGQNAGFLTSEGATLIDPSGQLTAGIPFCPPEGDAGTGMVATNCVQINTANISLGTSIFAMIVLDSQIKGVHKEIDPVCTPTGEPVAMVHSNNGCSQIDELVEMMYILLKSQGCSKDISTIYSLFYDFASNGDANAGLYLPYNTLAGEPLLELAEGRLLTVRSVSSKVTLQNVARAYVYSMFAALKIGIDLIQQENKSTLNSVVAQGGIFNTPILPQQLLSDVLNIPVSVSREAGEGGAWGASVLAGYMYQKDDGQSLSDYLNNNIFERSSFSTLQPNPEVQPGIQQFLELYKKGLPLLRESANYVS